jgi:hypothetical protein
MDYYSIIKKNEIMLFAGKWMDLEIIMLSEISQKETKVASFPSYEGSRPK